MDREKKAGILHNKFLPVEVEGFDSLAELALDLHWSWNHSADDVWRQIDPELWAQTRNPWFVLLTVSRARLQSLARDQSFRRKVRTVLDGKRGEEERSQWFRRAHPGAPLTSVAYFSMEFMLTEAMPIYSGGLGNVAGDQFKAASCLGIPVMGVGLLYNRVISARWWVGTERIRRFTLTTIPGNCPSCRSGMKRVNGCELRSLCQTPACGCARGRCRQGS